MTKTQLKHKCKSIYCFLAHFHFAFHIIALIAILFGLDLHFG